MSQPTTTDASINKQMESTEKTVERPDGGHNSITSISTGADAFYDVIRLTIVEPKQTAKMTMDFIIIRADHFSRNNTTRHSNYY
jgi:hypothetical protein